MTIFISIASYRDPQLIPTIQDCLAKARYPDDLRFGICWQHGPDESALPYQGDQRFRILDVEWQNSLGACWARSQIMGLWQGEDFFLQLDSHHRFSQDWDAKLLRDVERCGSVRPVLTTYATPFTPGTPDLLQAEPMQMNFDRFTEEAIVLFRPGAIPNWQTLDRPVRARFLSAHFFFTVGDFVNDVPYDPDLYFIGEEITLAVRAYTHGYDLFHPPEIIVWHEYTREGRTKHWDDHVKTRGVEREWHERDVLSREKVKRFLADPYVGPYGCGTARSFEEYEAYAGISFRHRQAQDYTRRGEEPPNPPVPADWAERIRTYRLQIELDAAALEPEARADPHFWYVGFHNAAGREIYRADADEQELARLLPKHEGSIVIEREFSTDQEPATWTVWPASRSQGWLQKLQGPVERTAAPLTLVTALLDIGRGELDGPFARSFQDDDLRMFERLLPIDLPMVIYIDPRYADVVWKLRRPHNTKVIPLKPDELRAFPYFRQMQAIRSRPDWKAQAGWLPYSPQAALEYYNPLVMSKLRWLAEQARDNPFGTERLFWIDAGLCRTVGEQLLRSGELAQTLIAAAGSGFLCVSFPYPDGAEIHGFPRAALTRAAQVDCVDRVVRGGFFGGKAEAVVEAAGLYDALLRDTLDAGQMGTEESVLTILSYRHPELFRCYTVEANGLMGPFFEALLAGRAKSLLLSPPAAPEPAHDRPAPVLGEDEEVARIGASTFLGLMMMQNRNAPIAWDALFRHLEAKDVRIARIIEVGTGMGGLSVLLQIYCLARAIQFTTYDSFGGAAASDLFQRLQIDARVGDITHEFVVAEIITEIQKEGVSIVVCDGADKVGDVNMYADYLKTGDLILAHDYAPNEQVFEQRIKGRLWSWCEIMDAQVEAAVERNALEPVLPEVLLPAVWACWMKRGETVRQARRSHRIESLAVYVLTFNAPDQFQFWLESVEQVAPEILRARDKVLLNNSTDAATAEQYDQLCERYGFTQHRFDNIGINRGRLWCAQHFESDSESDAMVYFEDDMLLQVEDGLCRNGFRTRVPDLFELAKAIAGHEDLDFLKLSFTELHGDHTQDWAYFNLGEPERAEDFPNGPSLRVDAVKSYRGLSYLLGDVFYSNWPMLITRRGNRTMFLEGELPPAFEQLLMARAHRLLRAGRLRGGVLLASPINHNRVVYYAAGERKEC